MRTLSPTLQAAIGAAGRQPASSVTTANVAEHYALTRDDHGATPDAPSAAVVAQDGSLIRAYVSISGGSGTSSLYVQRITDVTQASQWTSWILLDSANVFGTCLPALSLNPGGVLRLFFADGPSIGSTVKAHESIDNGATWPAATTVFSGSVTIGGLASGGNDDLFMAAEPAVGSWDVRFCHKSAGVWSTPAVWSLGSASLVDGLAASWNGHEYYLAVSIWQSTGLGINGYSFDGSAWTSLGAIVPLDTGNLGRQMRFPALSTFDGLYRLVYVEHDDGSADANPYDRIRTSASLDFIHWSDRPPVSGQQVLNTPAWLKVSGSYWVTNCAYVFSWPVYAPGDPMRESDVSAQVLSFERRERPLAPSELRIVLSNQNSQYAPPPPGLARNSRVTLSEGYVTASGTELVIVGQYYVEHWLYQRSAGENELVVTAFDATQRLDREASQQWVYTNQSVGWLILEIAAKASLFAVSQPGTAQFSQVVSRFVVNPGETWRLALHRVIELYGADYHLDATEQLVVRDLNPADPSLWSFGPEILSAQWGSAYEASNHVRVFGAGVLAEVWDFPAIQEVGEERYRHLA